MGRLAWHFVNVFILSRGWTFSILDTWWVSILHETLGDVWMWGGGLYTFSLITWINENESVSHQHVHYAGCPERGAVPKILASVIKRCTAVTLRAGSRFQRECIMGIVVFVCLFKEGQQDLLCVHYLQNVQECGSARHSFGLVLFL